MVLQLAANALQVLLDASLAPAAGPYLQRQQAVMLSQAQRLAAALPLACDEGGASALRAAWLSTACLLARLCGRLSDSPPAACAERCPQTTWAVLMCLPRLAAALPLMLSAPGLSVAAYPFDELLQQHWEVDSIDSFEQLQQLLAGADAAVRIAAAMAPAVDLEAADDERTEAAMAHITIANALFHCGTLACKFATDAIEGESNAQLPLAVRAALQLHADGCRMLHHCAAPNSIGLQVPRAVQQGLIAAYDAAHELLLLARWFGDEDDNRDVDSRLVTSAYLRKCPLAHLHTCPVKRLITPATATLCRRASLVAAHWEALQPLAAAVGPMDQWPADQRFAWTAHLAQVAGYDPASLQPLHRQLLEQLLDAVGHTVSQKGVWEWHHMLQEVC